MVQKINKFSTIGSHKSHRSVVILSASADDVHWSSSGVLDLIYELQIVAALVIVMYICLVIRTYLKKEDF